MKTSRLILSSLLASSLAFGSLAHAQTTYVWVRPPEEGAGNWSDPDNWSQGSVPDSLDAVVMTGNWGAAQNDPFRTYILDQDAVVALFGVGWNDLTGNNGNSAKIVLEAGGGSHTLTIGSTTTTGTLFVGGNSSNGGWQTGRGGILTLKSGVTVNLLGASTYGSGGFYIGALTIIPPTKRTRGVWLQLRVGLR